MNKHPVLLAVIALNLLLLLALAFVYPHLMVSPGALVRGHDDLTTDCFACHAAWRGASSTRCTKCHATADVGVKTTKGVPIASRDGKVAFHQELVDQDCMACHSDHQGPKLTKRSRRPFTHSLLKDSIRPRCSSCHAAPQDNVHRRDSTFECSQCHGSEAWRPAQFDHKLLSPPVLARCEACHSSPTDRLHRQIKGSCGSCHGTQAWKPATFEHDKYFMLDRDHQAPCETCHKNNDFSRYTCYGCHEHSLAKVRSEHLEEGIRNFENCVDCHRNPQAEPREGGGSESGHRVRD